MKYSAYKLNKQGDMIQPCCTAFPICNQSVFLCLFLTVACWPAYRFLRRQVRWSGIPISERIFQFVVIHTIKGFVIVNGAKVDVFLELCCFFGDPTWSLVLLLFLNPAWTSQRTMDRGSWPWVRGSDQDYPQKKKCKKAKWLSEEALQIAEKRREVKGKGEKERYSLLNAEFQRTRRDKTSSVINAKK